MEQERITHELSHYLFKPWCEFCVMGKGTQARHGQLDVLENNDGLLVSLDFLHAKADGTFYEDNEEITYDDVFSTTLVNIDVGDGCVVATACELKKRLAAPDLANQYPVALVGEWLKQLCHRRIRLRHGGEP